MSTHSEQRSLTRMRAEVNARRVSDLTREFAVKIRSTQRSLKQARSVYDLLGKEDVPALLQGRLEVVQWAVRRQVLIECWETVTGQVWQSGLRDE